jgi:hypothetical protein
MPERRLSLWLTPSLVRADGAAAAAAEAFSELIGHLASLSPSAPVFAPHVTLLNGLVTSDDDAAIQSKLDALVASIPRPAPVLRFRHLEARDMYTQALIALTDTPTDLTALHERAKAAFPPNRPPPNPTYDPHLRCARRPYAEPAAVLTNSAV